MLASAREAEHPGATPLATAITATVAWYQRRDGTPGHPQESPTS